ncbi:hypothetical protein [Thermococcus sp.]|uniref:hypothetical protein n=1 Tax=Thermococcus sp. TaxID=35749 RepID=UPI002623E213|nr:hypothetical protein [Thermococcus sp.]
MKDGHRYVVPEFVVDKAEVEELVEACGVYKVPVEGSPNIVSLAVLQLQRVL